MTQLSITGPKGNYSFDGQVNRSNPNNFSYSGQITNNNTGKTGRLDGTRTENTDGTISKTGTLVPPSGKPPMSFDLVADTVAGKTTGLIMPEGGTPIPVNRSIGTGGVKGFLTKEDGTVIPIKPIGIG